MNQASTAWVFTASGRGACRQAEDASGLVLREGKKACLPEVVAAAIVPPLKGANVDSKKE